MNAMKGGDSTDSYAHNSSFQNYGFRSVAMPRLSQAIHHLTSTALRGRAPSPPDTNGNHRPDPPAAAVPRRSGIYTLPARNHIAIADLGCSHGRNTLDHAHFVISELLHSRKESMAFPNMEIQYFFSDLPSNDFNSLFRSLDSGLQEALRPSICTDGQDTQQPPPKIFTAGVPGSFYSRLFPSASLDLVICFYSLHWLSQVPPSLLDKASPAWNGGHVGINKKNPKQAVIDAYAKQYQIDLKRFLKSRAPEVTSGGIIFLFTFVRSSQSRDEWRHSSLDYTIELWNEAWQELAAEGVITQEELERFNLPTYLASQQEIEGAVKEVPELKTLHMETVHKVPFPFDRGDVAKAREQWVTFMSSVLKPTVDAYMGEAKSAELTKKLSSIVSKQADGFKSGITHDLVIASLQRL